MSLKDGAPKGCFYAALLIALGKDHALARLAGEDTGHHFVGSRVGNTTHRHFIFFGDLIFEFRVAAKAH